MPRWFSSRTAAPLGLVFSMLLGLAACVPPRVPAPVGAPQPAYGALPPAGGQGVPPPSGAGGVVKVGFLVPLSGANGELGKSILDAAQMALFEGGSDQLVLIPRDTQGTAAGAAAAANAVIGDGAQLILGPLLAPEVEAVKPVAQKSNVNVVAFSTITQLAGSNVFLMGFLPRADVAREVAFAREKGLQRFAALAPSTPYGRLMAGALRDYVGTGGTVTAVEFYDGRGDAAPAVQKLVTPGTPPAFQALMIPDEGAKLKEVAAQVRAAGADSGQVRLLGSGLWDDDATSGDPALAGGWYAAPPPEGHRDFQRRFEEVYKRRAPRLASLGYDAAVLAASLARAGSVKREAILSPSGYSGVDGLFRFGGDGLVQRGLAVLEISPGGARVVGPPPTGFPDAAY